MPRGTTFRFYFHRVALGIATRLLLGHVTAWEVLLKGPTLVHASSLGIGFVLDSLVELEFSFVRPGGL